MKMEFAPVGAADMTSGQMHGETVSALNPKLKPELKVAQSVDKITTILTQHLANRYPQPIDIQSIHLEKSQADQLYHLEYNLRTGTHKQSLTGVIHPQYIPQNCYAVSQQIYQQFKSHPEEKFAIPKPVCIIPELKMSLQHKVKTSEIRSDLIRQQNTHLAKRIARLINTLHQSDITVARFQGHEYIRRMLQQLITAAHVYYPALSRQSKHIVSKTNKLITSLPKQNLVLIHGNLTLNNISTQQDTLYLSGTEQSTMGNPCMDMGHLIADIQTQSFCEHNNWNTSAKVERALLQEYLHLNPEYQCETLHSYTLFGLIQQAYKAILNNADISLATAIIEQCTKRLE